MNLIDEQFFIDDSSGGLTTLSRLNETYREVAQRLLNHYVRLQVIFCTNGIAYFTVYSVQLSSICVRRFCIIGHYA
jgi:hypothetical protein